MKAKELMIGDWVCKLCKGGHNIPVKVLGVIDNVVDCLSRDGKRYSIGENGIVPKELKRVHLTKNGFSAINAEDNEFVYRDGYEVKVMIEKDIVYAIFLSIEYAEKNIWKEIKYVHELQQAMRIMGCDKEIIL